jgi:N-acetyl sugar amidotransferase
MVDFHECSQCVLNTNDDFEISFNQNGICNHCLRYEKLAQEGIKSIAELEKKVSQIKREGVGKQYDCIIGVSGGVDSTYVALKVKEFGLRPLVIHLDNGWNSATAVQNINNIIEKLGFDLYTHVINWEEFKDLQLSFLKASVVDLELTSDHAIFSVLYKLAYKFKIKYVISGFNITTEGILPKSWRWSKFDWLNIKSIHEKFGTKKLKTFPHLNFFRKFYYDLVLKIETIQILNYLDYDKEKAKEIIGKELGWKDYGGKHFESIITRFYQGYILPEKFGIDKRKAHLSSLICSHQITKSEALIELQKEKYNQQQYQEDRVFILKKFGMTEDQFEQIMQLPVKKHDDYPSYETQHYIYHQKFFKSISPLTNIVKAMLKKQ